VTYLVAAALARRLDVEARREGELTSCTNDVIRDDPGVGVDLLEWDALVGLLRSWLFEVH